MTDKERGEALAKAIAILGLDPARIFPTGSRVIAPAAVHAGSDWDYVCHVREGMDAKLVALKAAGWKAPIVDSYLDDRDDDEIDTEEFSTLRLGPLNLILTESEKFFNRWVTATHAAEEFNLTDKSERIRMFQIILYEVE